MNDNDYPRRHPPLDFDLMGSDYRPGDRSRREDDRYLFLEALLSARQQFYVSWVGRSIVDNAERPPSVLVGQLRDHLAANWHTVDRDDTPLLDALTTEHPLQPFSHAYFPAPAERARRGVAARRLLTFAREWREVHHALARDSLRSGILPSFEQDTPLTLQQLGGFLRGPAKAFFNLRLKVYLEQEDIVSLDQEPFTLGGLENWQLQDQLIQAQRRAVDAGRCRERALDAALARLEGQGVLALGAFGERMREELIEPMPTLFDAYAQALEEWPHPVAAPEPIHVTLPGRPPLEDWLDNLRLDETGERCRLLLTSSSLIKKNQYQWHHLLRPWVAHLAGHLAGQPLTTRLLSKAGHATLPPLDPQDAAERLQALIDAWQAGMNTPLPLGVDTGFAWLGKQGTPQSTPDSDAWQAALKAYEGDGHHSDGEAGRTPYLARCWPNFDALMQAEAAEEQHFAALVESLLAPLHRAIKGKRQ